MIPGRGRAAASRATAAAPRPLTIALAGNPNVGKSTLFNALTGGREHVGNWPGKTVERVEGRLRRAPPAAAGPVRVVDLPGTYSLAAGSPEEEIAREFILAGAADVVVDLVDATNLERNLNLTLQLLELTDRVVLALNFMDEVREQGAAIDVEALAKALGVPVVPIVASRQEGLDALVQVALAVASGRRPTRPIRIDYGLAVERLLLRLERQVQEAGWTERPRWLALRLLEDDPQVAAQVEAAGQGELVALARRLDEGLDPDAHVAIVRRRYEVADRLAHGSMGRARARRSRAEHLDRVLTHPVWSWPIMLAMAAAVFWITIRGANVPSEVLAAGFNGLAAAARGWLGGLGAPWWLSGALVDGLVVGTGAVIAVMLPPMVIFFTAFALLEDAGLLPRLAFNLDRVMRVVGSQGRHCLTCAMSYGCNVTGVLTARIIDNPKDQLVAILTSPLIICNGRFGAGIVLVILFFPQHALAAMTALVALSLAAVLLATYLLNTLLFRQEPRGLTLELPPFRRPLLLRVAWRTLVDRVATTMWRAVAFAAPTTLAIWALGNLPPGAPFEATGIGRLISWISPLGRPWGFSGEQVLALLFTLPAKEIVVPSLAMTYGLQTSLRDSEAILSALAAAWTPLGAFTFILFYMLYMPCLVTVWAIWKETRSARWVLTGVVVSLAMAGLFTTPLYWGGRWLGLGG